MQQGRKIPKVNPVLVEKKEAVRKAPADALVGGLFVKENLPAFRRFYEKKRKDILACICLFVYNGIILMKCDCFLDKM